MSIALRNLEEKDLEAAQSLMMAQAGVPLAASGLLTPEVLKAGILVNTAFGLAAEDEEGIRGITTILMEQESPETVVGLLCRLCVPDTPERPSLAPSLVSTAIQSLEGNLQLCCAEMPAPDLWSQAACEQSGFLPCGYLPQKFMGESRYGAVVYAFLTEAARNARRPHPKIISSAKDLAIEVLKTHGIIEDVEIREDVVAYPTECNFTFAPIDADAVQTMLQSQQQQNEIFRSLQGTHTRLNLPSDQTMHMAAKDGDRVIGVISFVGDPFDKCVQILGIMALDGEPQGFLIASLLEALARDTPPDYWEVMVSANATRMQKTFDQVGFVPCAYLPSFGMEQGQRTDAIKMVKLNAGYQTEPVELTSSSRNLFAIIDTIFREHSVGLAVLKLLRDLRIFRDLGEGELRRVARLFSQKLYRPGEVVFEEGSKGQELYVVERGEIEIRLQEGNKTLGTIRNGAILGEIAFLNGEPRTAHAISKTPTIVRVIHRSDFDRLIQQEIHLGIVFFKNVALDLIDKLKQSNIQSRK